MDGKVEELRERLKKSKIRGKINRKLSKKRRLILSGPAELEEHLVSA